MIATIPVLRDARVDLVHPDLAQPVDDEGRRLVAVEVQFRMLVQMPPPALHFLGISGDTVQNGHGGLRPVAAKPLIKPQNRKARNARCPP